MTIEAELDHAWTKRHDVLYKAELSALYHQKRERFFELLDKLSKAAAVFGGSAALWKVGNPDVVAFIAVCIMGTSSLSLVFSFSERSKRHSELARSFRDVIAEITSAGDFDVTDSIASAWAGKVCSLEAKEPPTLAALTVMCQNELAIARNERTLVHPQSLLTRWTAHFFDMPQTA